MGSFDDIKKRLLDNLDADWITGLWGSSSDCEGFFKRMTIDEAAPNPNPNPKTVTDLNVLVDFGDKSKYSSFGHGSQLFSGSSVVNQLVKVVRSQSIGLVPGSLLKQTNNRETKRARKSGSCMFYRASYFIVYTFSKANWYV